jgi:hypothetical protein
MGSFALIVGPLVELHGAYLADRLLSSHGPGCAGVGCKLGSLIPYLNRTSLSTNIRDILMSGLAKGRQRWVLTRPRKEILGKSSHERI